MKIYKSYLCRSCEKTLILLAEEISTKGYLKCPHCSAKNIKAIKETDNLKECMGHATYKKEHGAIRQVK